MGLGALDLDSVAAFWLAAIRYSPTRLIEGRTFATHLNVRGIGVPTIQKLMGHRHIDTTALHCEVSDEIMRSAVELV
jgi:site-specific recombinase XerD